MKTDAKERVSTVSLSASGSTDRTASRFHVLTLAALSGLFLWLLADAGNVRRAAAEALALCGQSAVPALFPFLTVSGLLVSQGFGEWAAPLFSGLMTPLFRLPGTAGGALALGLAGGYPVGAKAAADLYRRGLLTPDEAERLLTFCNNASPAYLISVLGAGVFGSSRTGVWLYLIHVLSALLTGLAFRGRDSGGRRNDRAGRNSGSGRNSGAGRNGGAGRDSGVRRGAPEPPPVVPPVENPPFLTSLSEALGGAALATVRLCGAVVFFSTLASPLRAMGGLRAAASAGLLDLFSVTPLLTADRAGFVLASALTGFGGLGVLCQTAAALDGSGLPVRPCVYGKAVQGIVAGGLAAAVSVMLF